MKKIWTQRSLFFAVIFLVSSAIAAEEVKIMPKRASFLKLVDKNSDGKASKAEFFVAMEKKFHSMDVDKSDVVSVQELKIYGEKDPQAKQAIKTKLKTAFEKKLSEEAFTKRFTDRAELEFARLDKNHDNQLSADELGTSKAQQEKKPKNKSANQKKDSKDDLIVWITNSAEQNFFLLDKNYDGELSRDELTALASELNAVTPERNLSEVMSTVEFTDQTLEQPKVIKSFFVGVDANHDGKVKGKEKNTAFERLFNRLDSNQDAQLSSDELQAGKMQQEKKSKNGFELAKKVPKEDFMAWFSESAEQKFFQLDRNYDGQLSDYELGISNFELKGQLKSTTPELDSNSAASTTESDDKATAQQKLIKSFFVGIDANHDGQISNKEKNAAFERLFNRMDTNHDQFITPDEIIAGRHASAPDNP